MSVSYTHLDVYKRQAQWIVVEQDNSQIDTLESARLSIEGMKNL